MLAIGLPANSVQILGLEDLAFRFFSFLVFSSFNLHFCFSLFRHKSVFRRAKPALQSLLKLVISLQCPIYLRKYYSQVQSFAVLGSFSTEDKVPASSNFFAAHDKNQALSGRMHSLWNMKNNKMKWIGMRHPWDNSRQMVWVFSLPSKHKDDVQEKQDCDAKCSLRKSYLSDAVVSMTGDLL